MIPEPILTINKILCHSLQGNVYLNTWDIKAQDEFEIYTFEISGHISQGTMS